MESKIVWTRFDIRDDQNDDTTLKIATTDDPVALEESEGFVDFAMPGSSIHNTILGPIDIGNKHSLLDHFNIYIMDTNFTVSLNDIIEIGKIDGVELLHPISKYKMAVGIGILFNDAEVRVEIEHFLTGKHKDYLTLSKIHKDVRKEAISTYQKVIKYPNWIIYIYPNGNIETYFSTDKEQYKLELEKFNAEKEISEGLLIYDSKNK